VTNSPYTIRRATAADAGVLARHRVAMFRDMGALDERDAQPLAAASRRYFETAIPGGQYVGWVIDVGTETVGGGGLLVHAGLPRPENVDGGEESYLLNVYVDTAHRRNGLARRLMETMLAWCREQGHARVTLHASDDGRSLYESLGFKAPGNEMRLVLGRR